MWVPQGWQWVDPLKEAEASKLAIEQGLSTLSDETASQGKDWEEVVEQRAREQKKIKELEERDGITIIASDSKQQTSRGTPAPTPEETIPV
jgi:capsid protein